MEVGDEVLSRSEHHASGDVRIRRVLQKFVRVSPILELNIAGRIIGTTAEHPFYAFDRGWINAKELVEGDRVLTENGQWLRVDGLKDSGRVETVYNVEVEEDHTYFVGEAYWGWAVWTHNASCDARALGKDLSKEYRARLPKKQAAHVVATGTFGNRSAAVRQAINDARAAIASAGIKINSAENGFWAKVGHNGTHTDAFFLQLGKRLNSAVANGNVSEVLATIRFEAIAGYFRKRR